MSEPITVEHRHRPVYRVVRADWPDPLDASFSRAASGNRWNTADFGALYCCCSEGVARAVALDIFRMAGVEMADLRPQARPQLVEIGWEGVVADVCTAEGVAAAGLPPDYPAGADRHTTRRAAAEWHGQGREGVVCRSASVSRLGVVEWEGPHERWGEVAIFVANARRPPELLTRRDDLDWFVLSRTA